MYVMGIDPTKVRTSTEGPEFRVGTLGAVNGTTGGPKVYVYVSSVAGVTAAGYVCTITEAAVAEMVTTTTAAAGTLKGARVGTGTAAIAANGYGWVQIYGVCSVRCAAAAAIYTELYTTATAGALDDASTAVAKIDGLVITAAAGGAATVAGFANWPKVGLTT
jgi:hypothetical protein